jgi:hypothetical protein
MESERDRQWDHKSILVMFNADFGIIKTCSGSRPLIHMKAAAAIRKKKTYFGLTTTHCCGNRRTFLENAISRQPSGIV